MKLLTHAEFVKRVAVKSPGIKVKSKYLDSREKVLYECSICKTQASVIATKLITQGCLNCKGRKKGYPALSETEVRRRVTKHTSLRFVSPYSGEGLALLECRVCGRQYTRDPRLIAKSDYGRGRIKHKGCCSGSISANNASKSSKIKLISHAGKSRRVQGYEPQAIKFLVDTVGIKESHIKLSKNLRLTYSDNGKVRTHVPDIYIPKMNIVVEVKSTYTLGIMQSSEREALWFDRIVQKRASAIEQGYDYRVLVMKPDGSRLVLPKGWFNFSHKRIVSWFKTNC